MGDALAGIAQKLREEAAICGEGGGPYTWDEYRGQALERGDDAQDVAETKEGSLLDGGE